MILFGDGVSGRLSHKVRDLMIEIKVLERRALRKTTSSLSTLCHVKT
jgi:hypothetical protein